MNVLQRVFMNVSFRTVGEVGKKLIGFGFVIFLAHTLGAEGLGDYGFMLLYTNLFAMIVDAGLNTLYVREAAKAPESRQELLSALMLIKLVLSAVMICLILLVTRILSAAGRLDLASGDFTSLTLFTLYWVLNSTIDLVNAVYVEQQKLAYDAAINLGHRALGAVLGIVLVLAFGNVLAVSVSYLAGAAISLIVTSAVVSSRFEVRPWPRLGTGRVRHLLRESFPLTFSLLFSFSYFHIDVAMLKMFTSKAVVGWYVASFRILEVTMLLPGAAAMVILPHFARLFVRDKEELVVVSGHLIRLLFATGFFVSFILATLAGRFIAIFGKDFGPDSQLALQILVWTVPLIYVDYVLIYLLVASGHQMKNVVAALFCTILNVSLNYLLIPAYSYKGAAFATVVTQILLMVLSAHFVKKPLPTFRMHTYIGRVAAAGVLGVAALWLLRVASPELTCVVTLAVFVGCLLAFRGISGADKALLSQLLSRRVAI